MTIDEARVWLQRHADNTPMPGAREAYKTILDALNVARRGKWEVVTGSNGKEYMVCTNCRKQQALTGVFSYCPNCGAKMEGD